MKQHSVPTTLWEVVNPLSDAMSDTYLYAKSSQRAEDEIYIKFWEFMIGKSESDYRLFSENKFIYIVLNDKDLLEWRVVFGDCSKSYLVHYPLQYVPHFPLGLLQ